MLLAMLSNLMMISFNVYAIGSNAESMGIENPGVSGNDCVKVSYDGARDVDGNRKFIINNICHEPIFIMFCTTFSDAERKKYMISYNNAEECGPKVNENVYYRSRAQNLDADSKFEPIYRFRGDLHVAACKGKYIGDAGSYSYYKETDMKGNINCIASKIAKKTSKTDNALGPKMVIVPGKSYEIGKYEVTQKEWREVMGTNPSSFNKCGDDCPVDSVSWDDAQEFIKSLNTKTGKIYRLPTGEEWLYACYGGNQTEYCGGNNLDSVAWYEDNSSKTTHQVGLKQSNSYGIYDMSGNVNEWVQDGYEGSSKRASYGGSYNDPTVYARAVHPPFMNWSDFRHYEVGFRVARTLP
jgi:Sulfatase-modifying factor enzyme 1